MRVCLDSRPLHVRPVIASHSILKPGSAQQDLTAVARPELSHDDQAYQAMPGAPDSKAGQIETSDFT